MKIIKVDNFDRDCISDILIAEKVPKFHAKRIVELLNEKYSGSTSSDYYMVKPDDYKLYNWEP